MGLAAHNARRERERKERERLNRLAVEQLENLEQANKIAVDAVVSLFDFDRENPAFIKNVIGARVAYNALTVEQKGLVMNLELLEQAEIETVELLNANPDDGNGSDKPPDDGGGKEVNELDERHTDNASGVEETPTAISESATDSNDGNGSDKPTERKRRGK